MCVLVQAFQVSRSSSVESWEACVLGFINSTVQYSTYSTVRYSTVADAAKPGVKKLRTSLYSAGLALLRVPSVPSDLTGAIAGNLHYSTGAIGEPLLYEQ